MDNSKKPKDKKASALPLTKLPKNLAVSIIVAAEANSILEETEISLGLLKRQDIQDRIAQMPTSEDITNAYHGSKPIRGKKPDDHFSKIEHLFEVMNTVENFKGVEEEEVKKYIQMAIKAGVRVANEDQTEQLRRDGQSIGRQGRSHRFDLRTLGELREWKRGQHT
jgi:hypothetical protein